MVTYDVVALVHRRADLFAVVEAMVADGADLLVERAAGEESVVQVFDGTGRLLISVEVPVPVEVPGEIERLLGIGVDALPVWWIEVRAGAGAEAIARDLGARLVHRLGGRLWIGDDDGDDGDDRPSPEAG